MNTTDLTRKRLLGAIVCIIFISISLVSCDPRQEAVPIPIPMSTYGFAQCLDDPEGFYVIGGRDEWDHPLDTFLRYGAVEGIWYRLSPLPEASAGLAATCWQGKIYVVTPEQHLFIYDIQNETWSEGATPARVTWGAALGTWQGKLYLVSGAASEWGTPTSEVNIYDIAADSWTLYTGEGVPVPARFPGYNQAGPYLYVVGGFGNNSPGQNVDATQRLDLSTLTWELGPTFTSARAALSLSITDYKLYAAGGDVNSGGFFETTTLVENLDLTAWPQGSWTDTGYGMAPALMYDSGGFCTEPLTGGEIWTVGGAQPDEEHLNAVTTNQYGNVEEGCLHGLFNLQAGPTTQEGIGFPGEEVIYTISVTNTGGIPDAYAIATTSDWPIEMGILPPVWSGRTASLAVTVTVPLDVLPGDTDTAQVMITSQGDPNQSASLSLTTRRYGELILEPAATAGSSGLGEAVAYPITLRNATGQVDSFDLELGVHEWETMLSAQQIGPLLDGGEEIFTLTVNIPADVPWYSQDEIVVTARSQTNPGQIYASSQVTTTAYAPPDLSYAPETMESVQQMGETVTQTLTISNGNGVTLTYTIFPGGFTDDFSSDTGMWEYTYDSYRDGDEEYAVLTPLANSQVGIVWLKRDITQPFTVEFRYKVGGGDPAGDGFVFMFYKNSDYIPSTEGSCLGFGPTNPYCAAEGYGVEFDGFNYGNNDPSDHHIALIKDDVSTHLASVDDYRVKDNQWHQVKIIVSDNGMTMQLDGDQILTWEGEFDHTFSDFGFSAATAVALDWHIIDDFRLSFSGEPANWLRAEPSIGTIPANSSQPIEVTFDAISLTPDTYTTTLHVLSNDPLNPLVQVPVTMTVSPTSNIGWVEGVVSDLRTGQPMEAMIITEGQSYSTTSDIETGYYKLWLEQGSYTLQLSALGYVTQTAAVDITPLQGVTQDFALLLDAPWLGYSPGSINVTQMIGQVTTQTLILSNTGTTPLNFNIEEGIHGAVLALHMDEPDGSTTFHDNSGYGNNAVCFDNTCPIAGVPGVIDTSVHFDGLDDYLQVPHNTEFDQIEDQDKVSITAWVNVIDIYGNLALFTQYESDGDTGWGFYVTFTDIVFGSHNSDSVCNYNFNANEWYHVAMSYDRSLGSIQFYVNGSQICNNDFSSDILDTTDDPGFIGFNIPGGDEYSPGFIDELFIFNRTLSPEEIMDLYLGTTYGDTSWLSIDPISGTVPINETAPVQVVFNANNVQPDTYTTTLYIISNDPLAQSTEIPITMTVEPTQHMGWVEGIITDLRTGEPLEATIIAERQTYTVTSDAETGYYQLWLDPGWYTLQVDAAGHNGQSASVHVRNRQGVTQDFALLLDAPWLEYSPASLESTQDIGQVTTQTLTLSNFGTTPLEFDIGELITGSVLILHLDEPPGSTTFHDDSGYENRGSCAGDSCPFAGVGGMLGHAVDFDGINDYISILHSPEFDVVEEQDKVTIAAWIHIRDWNGTVFPIIDVDEAEIDYGWAFEANTSGIYLWMNDGSVSCGFVPNLTEWYHIAFTYDRSLGIATFYVNGTVTCQTNFAVDIPDTVGDSIYVGWSKAGPDEFSNGIIDELVVFDRSLSPEEIMELYRGRASGDILWLSVDPITGTIPTNETIPVQVVFDATNVQPDAYTTTLYISSNDPLNPQVQVPITMTVNPPIGYGELAGTVSSPRYCDQNPGALAGAELLIESSTGITWTVITDEDGHYSYWLDENGSPYTITAVLPGYETVITTGVMIIGQQTTLLDFSLRWLVPCIDSAPDQLSMTLPIGLTGTLPLVITNTGAISTPFELIERNAGQVIPIQKAAVELNIPAGPEVPPVGSAVAAGPYTPRQETTHRIQPQDILVEPPRVLLLHADDGDGQWIHDQLLAYGDLAAVDSFNAKMDTPSLADLQPYAVVLTWSNYPYADPVAIGDVLADYVDAGGYVINLMYALGEHGWQMEGRFMDEAYNAIQGGLVKYETSCLGEHHPTHFIFNGVEDVCEFYRLRDTSLTPGASVLAHWQDGEIFIASNASRSVISITGYVGYYYRWTGQMDRVVHNAILWFMLGDDIPWLETVPVSGTLPADGGSANISILFDTLNYQPGEYAADLLLFSNDPVQSPIQVPISLTITPNPNMGWVEGTVTDLRTGKPMEASIHAHGQPYTVTSDADTGAYLMWLESGSYTLEVSAPGYVNQVSQVEIISGTGTTQDFALMLDAPWLQYNPQEIEVMVETDQVISRTLTLTNTGTEDLEFQFSAGISGAILSLHLDEPAGATIFNDTSGFNNHASCSDISCPQAGVDGIVGSAIHFDGTNDYIAVPHNDQFDQLEDLDRLTIAAWVNIDNLDQGWFAVLDQYESTDDGGWEFTFYNSGIGGCDFPFSFGDWFHVVGVFDLSSGYRDFYFNGELFCHFTGGLDFPDTSGEPAYIGFSPTGPDEYAAGLLDEIYVFDQALSAEEVMIIYAGGTFGDLPWLTVDPTSGGVSSDSAFPVQVTFDATDLPTGTYTTTIFLTTNDPLLPVAQIPVTMTVTEVVTPTYEFTLLPLSPTSQAGRPGDVLTYTLQVSNTGNLEDSYTVAVSATWDTAAPPIIGPLLPGEAGELVVAVTVPQDAQLGDQDMATLTLTSQGDPLVSKQAALTSTAAGVYVFELQPIPPDSQEGYPGDVLTYSLQVSNLGDLVDSYNVEVSATWEMFIPNTIGPLMPGDVGELTVMVTVPLEAQDTDQDMVTLTLTSQGDPLISQQATLTSIAILDVYDFAVQADPSGSLDGYPGEVLNYTLVLSNLGNRADSYSVEISATWETTAALTIGPLLPGEEAELAVVVTIPLETLAGDQDIAILTITSQGDQSASKQVTLTSAAIWHSNYIPLALKN